MDVNTNTHNISITRRSAKMPIFFESRLVFVHIPKNAGRSIEATLLGDSSRDSPDGGRRSILNRAAILAARATAPDLAKTHLIGTFDQTLAAQHLTYVEMEMSGLLPERESFKTFCVARNPYDRALSSVIHFNTASWIDEKNKSIRHMGFEKDLKRWLMSPISDHNERAHRRSQVDFIRDRRGEVAMDAILRFESLVQDFSNFCAQIGKPNLRIKQCGHSGRSRGYRDYFSPTTRKIVEDVYQEDIEFFKYRF